LKLDAFSRIVSEWASTIPEVREAFIFGSRVKGTCRDDSDLDVAIKLVGEDEGFLLWMHEAENLRPMLSARISVPLDLQMMHSADSVVMPAVVEHGVRVFERSDS
jgi:predicted nucleotidyltransferase